MLGIPTTPKRCAARLAATLFALMAAVPAARGASVLQALPLNRAGGGAHGMALTEAQALLGRYGLTAREVMLALAPHLERCSLRLLRSETSGALAVHEVYDLHFGQYRVAGASLHLHHHANKLVMLRAELPDFRLPQTEFTPRDFIAPEDLGFLYDQHRGGDTGIRQQAEAVIAESSGFPSPAWQILRHDEMSGQTEKLLVDAQTGAVLAQESVGFAVADTNETKTNETKTNATKTNEAKVYERSPHDGKLVSVELPGLPGTGYLDGKDFVVYAPGEADPRVQAPDGVFDFLPDDPADALLFDQVQTYYAATRALNWFRTRFGYEPGATPMIVRINTLVRGRADNAQFLPPPLGPELQLGRGNEQIRNLARDSDVVTHELAHALLYRYVQSYGGEAGILHEGYSDYFAYALNGDPHLGESLVPGAPYLRTAALPRDVRFDATPTRNTAHIGGQIWSALLWELRAALREKADELAYASLAYLGSSSGIRDALLALLSADRDLAPLPKDDPEHGIYGANKCTLLATAVGRGFAVYLGDFDGASCKLDLVALAEDSRKTAAIADGNGPIAGKHFGLTIGGKSCAVLTALGDTGEVTLLQLVATLSLFLLPLGCSLLQALHAPVRRRRGPS